MRLRHAVGIDVLGAQENGAPRFVVYVGWTLAILLATRAVGLWGER